MRKTLEARTSKSKQPAIQAASPADGARNLIARPLNAVQAIDEALVPLRYREAVRIGALGDTGCGKSHLIRAIIKRYQELSTGIVFVVAQDAHKAAGFGGQVRKWPTDLKAQPLAASPRIVVFTGDCIGDARPLVAASQLAWQYSAKGFPTLVVFDEIANAVHPRAPGTWQTADCMDIARLFKEGRGPQVSVLWATQFPQEIPLAVLNETEDVFAFRLAGSALNNLRKKGFTTPRAESVLNLLPDTKTPPPLRGAHLRLQRGHEWDGKVYRVQR